MPLVCRDRQLVLLIILMMITIIVVVVVVVRRPSAGVGVVCGCLCQKRFVIVPTVQHTWRR